ncbi:MAG: NAD(P)-dependent oxidoreductase [bacterium]
MKILVTGGLGFIGFNLCNRLTEESHDVCIIDSKDSRSGFNKLHSEILKEKGAVIIEDTISNTGLHAGKLKDIDIVFNLASLIGHMDSMKRPVEDLKENTAEHVAFLQFMRTIRPRKIIYTSTRQIYGNQEKMPVDENTCPKPVDVNGINKYTTELYHRVYGDVYDFELTVMRLTNIYGPGMHIRDNRLSFLGWFINRGLTGNDIEIFGSGRNSRDMLYIDDLIETIIRSMDSDFSGIVNIGGPEESTIIESAEIIEELCTECSIVFREFPQERKKIDIGNFITDNTRARDNLGHNPKTGLKDGLKRTLEYFRQYREYYI